MVQFNILLYENECSIMEELAEAIREGYLKTFSSHFAGAENTPFYLTDFVIFGIMDRNIGLVESMPTLIKEENIHALAPLLRVQLDSLLRLYAFNLVSDQTELAHHIIAGNELNKFKDSNGKFLSDRHLVNSLSVHLPFVETMYKKLCGWVHFSESHIFTAISEGKEDRSIEIGVGAFRKKIDPKLFIEAIESIKAIHFATIDIMKSYFEQNNKSV